MVTIYFQLHCPFNGENNGCDTVLLHAVLQKEMRYYTQQRVQI